MGVKCPVCGDDVAVPQDYPFNKCLACGCVFDPADVYDREREREMMEDWVQDEDET